MFNELAKKPWLADDSLVADPASGRTFALAPEKIALRVFLTVVTVLFALIVVVYSDRMLLSDWRTLQDPWLLWVNTALLIAASAAFHWAQVSVRQGRMDTLKTGLQAAGLCTFAFLVGQLWVTQQLSAAGFYIDTGPAVAFFYLITALHGLHILGGLVAWVRCARQVWRGQDAEQVSLIVELCATYWHYLLVLWLVLFGLLVTT